MADSDRPVDVQIGDTIVRVPRRRRIGAPGTPEPFIGPPLPPDSLGGQPAGGGLILPPIDTINAPLPMEGDEVVGVVGK